ncbi:MAG: DUF2793 domain-containing protein [Pseudomonadota bacterium]
MTETARLSLPLVQAAQAQKHVTVNEALARLDGLVQLRIVSLDLTAPPTPVDGAVYAVPAGASGDWFGQDRALALAIGGGWEFVTPESGWTATLIADGRQVQWSGTTWETVPLAQSTSGASAGFEILSFEHDVAAGASDITAISIPANAMVFAVSARVTSTITGSLSNWQMGTGGACDRFGSGLGLGLGSFANGVLSQPLTYYSDTPLILTAEGGTFDGGGQLSIAIHYMRFALPEV